MNLVRVNGIYEASDIVMHTKRGDDQIIVRNPSRHSFLDDISIFVDSPSGLTPGDKFRILNILEHTRSSKKEGVNSYKIYSSIRCVIEKVNDDGETVEIERKEKW